MNIQQRTVGLYSPAMWLMALAVGIAGPCYGQATTNPDVNKPVPVAVKPEVGKAEPGWWNDAVFYQVFVRSFADSTEGPLADDGIGDIRGLISKLDYLNDGDPATTTDLGITAIWMMPITSSPSYHGYDTTDYRTVEKSYGTNEDFKELMVQCKKRGIRVVIDLVLNHCSNRHPFFIDATNPKSPKRDWFIWQDRDPGYRGPWGQQVWHRVRSLDPAGTKDEALGPDGRPKSESGPLYYGIFSGEMPDFNFRNPAVTAEMIDMCRYWLNDVGIDGFRLDAIRHLIEDGKQQDNTPETHEWLKQFRTAIKAVKKDAFNVGEVWAPTETTSTYITDQLDNCFEFDLALAILGGVNTGEAAKLAAQIRKSWEWHPTNQFSTFLANHDQARSMTTLGKDENKAKLAAGILLTLPGVPFIYYGEEIGMVGDKPDPKIRTPMQWSEEQGGGFTTGKPWQALNPDFRRVNVARQASQPKSLWSTYRSLIALRNSNAAIRHGGLEMLSSNHPSVLAYIRMPAYGEEKSSEPVMVVVNLGSEAVTKYSLSGSGLKLGEGKLGGEDLLGTTPIQAMTLTSSGGLADVTPVAALKPRSVVVFKLVPAKGK